MEEPRKKIRKIMSRGLHFIRKAWMSALLVFLGGIIIAAGFYTQSQPDWIVKSTRKAYNKGIETYQLPPGVLPASDGRPSEYPIERSRVYFEMAIQEGTDKAFKAVALYNLGTLLGREAYASSLGFGLIGMPRVEMSEAILMLSESVRLDPTNENAKYNLEVLDNVKSTEGEKEGAPGPGYSPGSVNKGF